MEEKLIEYSDKIIEALESGIDFASEQAPLLIQEILTYYAFYHSVLLAVFTFMVISFWGISIYIFKKQGASEPFFVFPLIFGCMSMIGVIANSVWLYKVIYAPRFFLIQELGKLL